MKVELITRHAVPNYGSLLQSYATQFAIEKLGHDSEIINYIRYDEKSKNLAKTLVKGKKWDKNKITRLIYNLIQVPNYVHQYNRFFKYRKKLLKESKDEYNSLEQLKNNVPICDVFCSGSDQIWGSIGKDIYDEAYFLSFAEGKKCISYASSFGKTELNKELLYNLNRLLKKYKKILVREDSAKKILKESGLNNVEQVLDPTLLLSKKDWEKLADNTKLKLKDKYILIYQLHNDKKFDEYAKKFAKIKGLKLLRISTSIYHIFRNGKLIYLPSPSEFLKLFENAEYILTDSFHATVFSIIYNKKFMNVLPTNKTATRIESLHRLFNIEQRILQDFNDVESIDFTIDWNEINSILNQKRKESLKLLKSAIEE